MAKAGIVALGEPMIEFNQTRSGEPNFLQGYGGDTSNALIAAARQGAAAAYLTKLGRDKFGEMLLALWQREGVGTDSIVFERDAHTAVYFVTHDEQGHSFSYLRAGSAASRMVPADLNLAAIREAQFLHVSGISQAISASACDTVFAAIETARDAGVSVSYDSNLRLKLWPLKRAQAIIRATIGLSDYFLPSLEDAQLFTELQEPEAILDWCFAAGARKVLLKLGAGGVIVADDQRRVTIPGHSVNALDATGAGDCFAGSLLARLALGDDVLAAARYANAAAALTTTGFGAVAPIPRPQDVAKLLAAAA